MVKLEKTYIFVHETQHIAWHYPKMELFFYLGSIDRHLYLVIIAIPLTIHYHPYYLGNEMKDEMLIGPVQGHRINSKSLNSP